MNDWNKFHETNLPSMKDYYNKLQLKNITKEGYDHAIKVWNTFKIKNLGEYHDLYVQSDTAQLADVFENVRTVLEQFMFKII